MNRATHDRPEPADPDDELTLFQRYLREVSSTPLLSVEEESELAKSIEAGAYAAELSRRAEQTGRSPTRASAEELAEIARAGHLAKDRMIRANLRLVVWMAKKYAGRGRSFLDVIQDGNLGLIRAVERFDYARGLKFSTYATWWIRKAIQQGLADQGPTMHLPVGILDALSSLRQAEQRLAARTGAEPTEQALAAETGLSVQRIRELRRAARQPVSLDTPVGDGRTRVIDLVEELGAEQPADVAAFHALAEELRTQVASLPPREALVLTLRYGLDNDTPRSLQQIGDQLGLTRERIRQLQNDALAVLRDPEHRARLLDSAA